MTLVSRKRIKPHRSPGTPGADIVVQNCGGIFAIFGMTATGLQWLEDSLNAEPWQWQDGAVFVDGREYAKDIADGARDAGLEVR